MKKTLFWKFCLILATGVVSLFYVINLLTTQTENGMSMISQQDKDTLIGWGKNAEQLYINNDIAALELWLANLQKQENTWISVAKYQVGLVAGNQFNDTYQKGYLLGRNVEWKIHLYFHENPVMEIPFQNKQVSFLIKLPDRMRPGVYWLHTKIVFQIILPAILLALLSFVLYLHILKPMKQLKLATMNFSKGVFDIRAKKLMGNRNDEFSELAVAFDKMATHIGDQIISQRQLIADLSHELRTPLTRLDIALGVVKETSSYNENIERISHESIHIRKLVEDTLTLAWLENEKPDLQQENVELIDLLDVLIDDAIFEFPDKEIICQAPSNALIANSSHRAAGQALENVLRNALRYTPTKQHIRVNVVEQKNHIIVNIIDHGPGVPEQFLDTIFKPFFRVDKSRTMKGKSFGLGLALARRQLATIRATIKAYNIAGSGLSMKITFPKS
ncbi:MAG: histidine kinase sensor domain-containing protein [Litorilituus sp.]|jgi:two-component system sensor histidine kinase PfeS|nr:histidine kinase sensor domain-containing protein [Litorilituus sp.]